LNDRAGVPAGFVLLERKKSMSQKCPKMSHFGIEEIEPLGEYNGGNELALEL
jgi:hypothetical protein